MWKEGWGASRGKKESGKLGEALQKKIIIIIPPWELPCFHCLRNYCAVINSALDISCGVFDIMRCYWLQPSAFYHNAEGCSSGPAAAPCRGLRRARGRALAGLSSAGGGWEGGMGRRVLMDHKVCM